MKRFWLGLFVASIFGLLASCSGTRVLMQTAPDKPRGASATPPITAQSVQEWEQSKAELLGQFETHIYGQIPRDLALEHISAQALPGEHFDGSAKITVHTFNVMRGAQSTERSFDLVLVTPADSTDPGPIIMMQNFCPNHDVIPHPDIPKPKGNYFSCSGDGVMSDVFFYFFGRYITTPPIKEIMTRGYALAVMYPSEFVPDSNAGARAVLDRVFSDLSPETRPGAVAAWGAQFGLISDWLSDMDQFSHQIAYGHSRFGKSALVAAAVNPDIDAVISHQSGTGGASLNRNKPGETIENITENYSFWFNENYSSYSDEQDSLPVDQHQLLALIAPRPVFLGNARRDVWSDPNGAFRAAIGATPVYALYGKQGLTAERLREFKPQDDIAFWIRPGTHGVVKEDWPAFLEFLDAHFQ